MTQKKKEFSVLFRVIPWLIFGRIIDTRYHLYEQSPKARQLVQDASTGTQLPQPVLLDLVETILVYKLPSMNREEVRRMLELHDIDLRQTRFYQEVFAEGEARGEARGEIRLLQKLLTRRFGALPEWVEAKLASAEPTQLETWGERVSEAQSLEAVFVA